MFDFGKTVYPGETAEWTDTDGIRYVATVYRDDDATPPWDRSDGHGPVTNWERRDKAPGERVLNTDGRAKRYYDFAEAIVIAKRDGWGCEGGRKEGETLKAYRARAVERDFEFLQSWCDDGWEYVGVDVQAWIGDVHLVGQYHCACWGMESNSGAHVNEVAGECLAECQPIARAKIIAIKES